MSATAPTPPTPSTPPTPPLSGQDINVAARASRLALIAGLEPLDTTFEPWTVINLVGSGQATDETTLGSRLAAGIGLSNADIEALFAELEAADLLVRTDGALSLTAAGTDLFGRGSTMVAGLVGQLYAGFAPDDLATTRRVLVELTARAQACVA
jgi:hypothetical protein